MESQDYIWFEKYSPKTLFDLSYNKNTTEILRSLSQCDDFPHLIFYGIEGAGKKTRIYSFLEAVYGPGIRKTQTETREMKVNSQTFEYMITSSNFHLELCPADLEQKDRILIQNVIKETASVTQLDSKTQKRFKVVVLLEVDNLTKEAQAALRRTMEKYSSNCRIIMSCVSLNKIMPPIRSRCLAIRVGAPKKEEMFQILQKIAKSEATNLSEYQIKSIVNSSEGNLRRAINSLQLTYMEQLRSDFFVPEYIECINEIANKIYKDKSVNGLKDIRGLFYKLIVNCVPISVIFSNLMKEFLQNKEISGKKRLDIMNTTALYDNRAANGSKSLYHLEAYAAYVMCILKGETFDDK